MNNILETIKSRCQTINVPSPDFINWQKILANTLSGEYKKLDNEKLKKIYELSNASISFASNIITNNGLNLYEQIENIVSSDTLDIETAQILGEKLNGDEELYELFFYFLNLLLYDVIRYFATGKANEDFIKKNSNFILNNNQKSINKHIEFLNSTYRDIKIYSLNKKHAIMVIFNKISKKQ